MILVYGTHFQNQTCGQGPGQHLEVSSQVRVGQNPVSKQLEIDYETPTLAGNRFYCAVVDRDQHLLCGLRSGVQIPVENGTSSSDANDTSLIEGDEDSLCRMVTKDSLYLENRPFIYRYIPYCTSHFRCGWIYILVAGKYLYVCMNVLGCPYPMTIDWVPA